MVAASLVATRGVGSCTVRGVARAAGVSPGVVSHYFRDSREMVFAAYRTAHRSSARRFRAQITADGSLAGLLGALEASLPLNDDATAEWKVRIAFWGVSDFGDAIREFEENASDSFVGMLAELLQRHQQAGEVAVGVDTRALATELEALLTGLAIQHLMSPLAHPRESVRERLARQFYRGVQNHDD